jgi:HSP20 family protein
MAERRSRAMADLSRRREAEPRLTRWDPLEVMRDLESWDPLQQIERIFTPVLAGQRMFSPSFDVRETPDAYIFKADLPGIKEEDVDILLTGNRLTIRGKREQEERQEGEQYYAVERSYGSFTRTFTLPEGCDLDHVKAELRGGVLTVVVPKSEHAKPKRISLQGLKEGLKGITEGLKEGVKEGVKEIKEKVSEKLAS